MKQTAPGTFNGVLKIGIVSRMPTLFGTVPSGSTTKTPIEPDSIAFKVLTELVLARSLLN